MKLIVLIPSEEYRSYAGARIRYGRLGPELARDDVHLILQDIAGFDPRQVTAADVVLISKCHDAASLVATAAVRARGALAGFDLFDDYFSQIRDSRLSIYRSWLREIASLSDFALCSTQTMAEVIGSYSPTLPTHVVQDPAIEQDFSAQAEVLDRKLANARDTQRLRTAWFGMGDNPYFDVGLADLCAFGSALSDLSRSGMAVDLTVLTNRRALNAEGISLINRLSVPVQAREWSERNEAEVLREAFVAFLPVNAQRFSTAKSLNRAFTAMSFGCQILAPGFPLYADLEPLIYRDASTLVSDIGRSSLRLSRSTMQTFKGKIEAHGNPREEARKLVAFLTRLDREHAAKSSRLTVVHGHATRTEAHRLVRSADGLSVASPYCTAAVDFDVIFRGAGTYLQMFVSAELSRSLNWEIRARLSARKRIGGRVYLELPCEDHRLLGARKNGYADAPVGHQLATYASTMATIERRMAETFGPSRTILSETSPLPFAVIDRAS